MNSKIAKREKWYKPYDPIVWALLLVVLITVFMYDGNNTGYDIEEIPFNKDITTIKEAVNETDKIIKEKYGDKYKLYSISGYSNNIHKDINIQPDLEISYLKVKGLTNKKIDYNVSLEDDKIEGIYITGDTDIDRNINFNYNPEKLDLSNMLGIVEDKVDMEKVRSGYEPSFSFNMYGNEMYVYVDYYKSMKNSGVDYDSRVSHTFIVDIKTQKIKSESVDGIS